MTPSAVKRNGLSDQVIERVRALVANGTYKVGDRLPPEAELCELFDVGRSTIREAMRVLANRGLVDVRHGEGTFVASRALRRSFEERLGHAALRDIYEARNFIELPLAELAAERRSARDVAAMRAALKKRARAVELGDVAEYGEHDFAFHLAVAKACKNEALYDIYASFVNVVKPRIASMITPAYIRAEKDHLHADLCEAIARGDVRKTRRLVVAHLRTSLRGISEGIG